jgi:C1A family cysteine protease
MDNLQLLRQLYLQCRMNGTTVDAHTAALAVGYNDSRKAFLVRNSWGDGWGAKGYGWLPYAYMTNANWTADLWTIRTVLA